MLCSGIIYQVTSEIVSDDELGNYLAILARNVTFDADTKKTLTRNEESKVDWSGAGNTKRENWVYTDVYEVSGADIAKAVAVKVNNKYYLAKAQ